MGLSQFDENTALAQGVVLDAATGLGQVFLYNENPLQARVDAILATNDDVIAHVVVLIGYLSGVYYPIGSMSIPPGTGLGGLPSVDFLAGCLPSTMSGIVLDTGTSLMVRLEVVMTGTSLVTLVAQAALL